MIPILSTGKALIHTAIRSEQHALAHLRLWRFVSFFRLRWFRRWHSAGLDRERVMIGMSFFGQILAKVFSGVIRYEQCESEQIDALVIRGIDTNLTKIK